MTFYVAAGILLVWLSLITIKSGFFDRITYSFQKVFQTLNKQRDLNDEDVNQQWSSSFQNNFSTLKLIGLSLLIEMFILLFVYYL
ncbi:DUF3899 domain-containing protein [Bacillus sp. 179-C3.3 HS]|uniref:DUF3899 domain-containing protein n=1 Tax=Bacillus sp. 179-C3.3 HS TaxID=3232162 RepID=UPI0039A17411